MKKMFLTLALTMMSIATMLGMSTSKIRNHARFLTDRMAYELDLTPHQYDDVYEINYDYIFWVDKIMNDVVYGYRDAIEDYYDLLDERNDDLRYVLTNRQYRNFLDCVYFYRPIYTNGRGWNFRIYTTYSNYTFFYYDAPRHYKSYAGAHSHHKLGHSHYADHYKHQSNDRYGDHNWSTKNGNNRRDYDKRDFGVNHRNRNDKNPKNNYSNGNQNNRDNDSRYDHKSGNTNSPNINHRDNNNNGGNGNNRGGNTSTSTNRGGNSGNGGAGRNGSTSGSTNRSNAGGTTTRSGQR